VQPRNFGDPRLPDRSVTEQLSETWKRWLR
jgi:hypothetical protein